MLKCLMHDGAKDSWSYVADMTDNPRYIPTYIRIHNHDEFKDKVVCYILNEGTRWSGVPEYYFSHFEAKF